MKHFFVKYMLAALTVILFSVSVLADLTGVRSWRYTGEQQAIADTERAFLMRLGFEDYSDQAKQTLASLKGDRKVHPVNRAALKENANRWQFISHIRELTVLAMTQLKSMSTNEQNEALQNLISLTTNRLLPFPMLGLEAFNKPKVFGRSMGEEAKEKRDKYLNKRAQSRFNQERQAILGIYLSLLYPSQDIKAELKNKNSAIHKVVTALDKSITQALEYQYYYSGVQQTLYFGRSLAASLVRYSRLTGQAWIETELRNQLAKKDVRLDNYISNTLAYRDRQENWQMATVYKGDVINRYSKGSEAFHISIGVEPTDEENEKWARELKLVANKINLGMFVTDTDAATAQLKMKSNESLLENEELAWNNLWDESLVRGFSHAGLTDVKHDKESKISMVWVWDVLPYNDGGVRFSGVEGFSFTEKFNRIGFVHYNPKKTLAGFKKQIRNRGFMPYVWESHGSYLTNDEEAKYAVMPDEEKTHHWPSYIDEATVARWMNTHEDEATEWMQNELAERAVKMAKTYMVGREALTFSRGFYNMQAAAYCSQFVLLAYLQGANFDLQMTPDRWDPLVKTLTRISFGLLDYDLNSRIVSPNGFAWQKELVETVFKVNHSRTRYFAQINNHPEVNGLPTVASENQKLINELPIIKELGADLNSLKLRKIDPEQIDVDDDDI